MTHDLYHEAKRRASLPQPEIRYDKLNSLLLTAPNNIIFELFGTIVREVPGDRLLDYVSKQLSAYLDSNWDNKTVRRAVERLRREQTLDVKAGIKGLPLIKSLTGLENQRNDNRQSSVDSKQTSAKKETSRVATSSTRSNSPQKSPPLNYNVKRPDRSTAIQQIYEHIMWRIKTENVTQITSLLIKLMLDDGYRTGKLKAELYDQVAECFEDWRSSKLIKLYAFGQAPASDQKLLLSSTNKGDITKWVANYIDGSEKKQNPDLIRKLAGALRDKTKNCIYLTHDLQDAVSSLETDSIRCALLIDRQGTCRLTNNIAPLIKQGRLYLLASLGCIQFAPDPTSDNCC